MAEGAEERRQRCPSTASKRCRITDALPFLEGSDADAKSDERSLFEVMLMWSTELLMRNVSAVCASLFFLSIFLKKKDRARVAQRSCDLSLEIGANIVIAAFWFVLLEVLRQENEALCPASDQPGAPFVDDVSTN